MPFIVFGTRLYGRVDMVPGLFYVATRFFHICWIPIIPLGTQIVVGEDDKGWEGVPFGLSGRSLLVGYLRSLLIGVGVFGMVVGAIACFGAPDLQHALNILPLFGMGLVSTILGALTLMLWRHPTPAQFERLCIRLGMNPHEPISPAPGLPDILGLTQMPLDDRMVPAAPDPTVADAQELQFGPDLNVDISKPAGAPADENIYARDASE